ncbi:MAG TPA: 23S rRNA (uracil(1939)-C(5))-methyltransferase RlmD, partial [bacterium]|nr:23S rRNA (uracil(1939)-C(5))-methyltransferase RlmD [bacterium]
MEIILASASPRRQELLKKVVTDFSVYPVSVDETSIQEKDPVRFALQAAILKVRTAGEKYPDSLIIAADTVVYLDGRILGKPSCREEALEMLQLLSGTRHKVITGLALYHRREEKLLTDYDLTYVTFKKLNPDEIEEYLDSGDFADKAGGYAVQKVGDRFVEKLHGDYYNVVGFPVKKFKRLLEKFLAPELLVEVVDIALPHRWAVARYNNQVLFVNEGLPGDRIRVRTGRPGKNFFQAEAVKIEQPSPDRVQPVCPHFGSCGGCLFQDLTYPRQVRLKQDHLFQTLRKIAGLQLKSDQSPVMVPAPEIFYYRNKMEFAFGEEAGQVILGLRQRASAPGKSLARVVPLKQCLLFSPAIARLFPVFLNFARERKDRAYHPRYRKGFLRHLVLRQGKRTGQLMVILVTTGGLTPDFTGLTEQLVAAVPETVSFYWVVNNQISDVVNFEEKHLLWGRTFLEEKMGAYTFRIHPQSFFQPNTEGAELLYQKLSELVRQAGCRKVLGLYCGSGCLEIFLSPDVEEVTGVDISPASIATAVENCRINKVSNCHFQEAAVEKKLAGLPRQGFDLAVVDPPRAGLTPKALRQLINLAIPYLAYVSCNP